MHKSKSPKQSKVTNGTHSDFAKRTLCVPMIPDTMEYEKGTSVRHWWGMVGSLNLRLLTILRPYLGRRHQHFSTGMMCCSAALFYWVLCVQSNTARGGNAESPTARNTWEEVTSSHDGRGNIVVNCTLEILSMLGHPTAQSTVAVPEKTTIRATLHANKGGKYALPTTNFQITL